MPTTGYLLIALEALPESFWQTTDEDRETIARLKILERSLSRAGVCWLMWNTERQALYEQRDLYQCSVVRVVEHDVIGDEATPCGDLSRRESLPIFFSDAQFRQILSQQAQQLSPATL